MQNKIILSGIQPSGDLHIGNYLGAIKQWVELQKSHRVFVIIVDLHAITVPQDPEKLHAKTLETAALLLACGIDPKKSVLFIQSHVPAHTELMWILNTMTPIGELERMTQYKDKRQMTNGKGHGTFTGLLNYPVLQAADILLYQPDVVPIGEDQLQHLELTRALARKFNNRFGEAFKEPRPLINNDTKRIMGLDDPSKKISNLMSIYSAFSDLSLADIGKKYHRKEYSEFKKDLNEILVKKLSPIQKKYLELSKDKKSLLATLNSGSKKASKVANQTLTVVKEKVGFVL